MSGSEKEIEEEVNRVQSYINPLKAREYLKCLLLIISELRDKLRSVCHHPKTHFEDWPDGGEIEVCDNCGVSRYHWGQGETDWIWIKDIPGARQVVEETVEKIRGKNDKNHRPSQP